MPARIQGTRQRAAAVAVAASRTVTEQRPQSRPTTILIVDDEDVCRITMKWFLANFGFIVAPARSAEDALAQFDPETHDIIVTDNDMPGLTGAELAHVIKLRSPSTPVIMYTGLPPADTSCLDALIHKPAHLLQLKEAIDQVRGQRSEGEEAGPRDH